MNVLDSIILGIVEGITEFLPISSTGHLIITSHLLKLHGEVVDTFEVVIQLGAILAVVFLYHQRFHSLFNFKDKGEGFHGIQGWLLLMVTSVPIMALGFMFNDTIKTQLFNPTTVAWALAVGGVVLIVVEKFKFRHDTQTLDHISLKQAMLIGLFQSFALWPGVSRAGATIIGGMFSGLNRQTAAEYSFIAAVPIMTMVTVKDMIEIWPKLQPGDLNLFGVGFVVAFISAFFAVKTFVGLLQRHTLAPFGVYRIAMAALVLWMLG